MNFNLKLGATFVQNDNFLILNHEDIIHETCYLALRALLEFLMVPPFLQLTAVHLVDAHLCSDPGKYISALLLSLSTMLHLELPHVNVLSKIDLIESYGKLG